MRPNLGRIREQFANVGRHRRERVGCRAFLLNAASCGAVLVSLCC
jgi:hypothetical protein